MGAPRTVGPMTQHDYQDSDELVLADVGELDTEAWLALLAEEVELPEPVAVYLHEARVAGDLARVSALDGWVTSPSSRRGVDRPARAAPAAGAAAPVSAP